MRTWRTYFHANCVTCADWRGGGKNCTGKQNWNPECEGVDEVRVSVTQVCHLCYKRCMSQREGRKTQKVPGLCVLFLYTYID